MHHSIEHNCCNPALPLLLDRVPGWRSFAISKGPSEALHAQETAKATSELSSRDWEVMAYTARGMTNPEIGKAVWVSAKTVRFHLKSIFNKIQVSNRTEAAAWYFSPEVNKQMKTSQIQKLDRTIQI